MTIPEQPSQFSSSQIREGIWHINKLISGLLNGRNPGQLSSPEESQLSEYHRQKDEQFILALKARKAGDPTIKAGIVGKADEPPHECSRNWVQILFEVSTDRNYMQQAPFQSLQKVSLGNLMSLMDNPDYFIPELPEAYIIRTMREVSDVAFKAREIPNSRQHYIELLVSLAERVLRARKDRETGKGRIEVTRLKDLKGIGPSMDLINVAYAIPGRQRTTFNLVPPSYFLFPNNLERLIEEGGGYDRTTRRVR